MVLSSKWGWEKACRDRQPQKDVHDAILMKKLKIASNVPMVHEKWAYFPHIYLGRGRGNYGRK